MTDEKTNKGIGDFNRRAFIGAVAAVGAGAVIASCKKSYPTLKSVDVAPDGPVLKAGLIGCGNRGSGAALNFLKAGPNVQITALGDVLQDHMDSCRKILGEHAGVKVADDHCFVGFDNYKKLLETDVDVVILATPPHFRPAYFDAAVDAKKHCFVEKPAGVDAPGVRSMLATAQKAAGYRLSVVVGSQKRHDRGYRECYNRVANGAIGQFVAAQARCNRGQLWWMEKKKEWSDMEGMIRNWINWQWLSGSDVVESHVHNLDTILWFAGMTPAKVIGSGGRARRVSGDLYDYYNMQFTFPNGTVLESMCRNIDGCANQYDDYILGTEGRTNLRNTIWDNSGKVVWKYQEAGMEPGRSKVNPYEQEHVDLVTAIRTDQPVNEVEHLAQATLMGIMGRTACTTGREIKWDEMMDNNERLGPTEYAMGPVDIKAEVPVPGKPSVAGFTPGFGGEDHHLDR